MFYLDRWPKNFAAFRGFHCWPHAWHGCCCLPMTISILYICVTFLEHILPCLIPKKLAKSSVGNDLLSALFHYGTYIINKCPFIRHGVYFSCACMVLVWTTTMHTGLYRPKAMQATFVFHKNFTTLQATKFVLQEYNWVLFSV